MSRMWATCGDQKLAQKSGGWGQQQEEIEYNAGHPRGTSLELGGVGWLGIQWGPQCYPESRVVGRVMNLKINP